MEDYIISKNKFSFRPRDFQQNFRPWRPCPGPHSDHGAVLASLQADLSVEDNLSATLQANLSVQEDLLATLQADPFVQAEFLATLQADLSVQGPHSDRIRVRNS